MKTIYVSGLRILLAAALAVSSIARDLWAQDDSVDLKEVVVTATRSERGVDMTSKSVTVIPSDKIVERNAWSVQEILEEVPGISLSRAGGLAGQISMRGSNSNDPRLVLFIDGDRFRGRNTREYSLFDPAQIERIEVIRGPASALYGPDAMVGIVNIITRRAQGDVEGPLRLTPKVKSLNYNSANNLRGGRAELEMVGRGMDLLMGVSGRKADNYRSAQGEIPNSDFKMFSGDLRLGYRLAAGHRLEISGKFAEVEAGDAGGIAGSPGGSLLRRRQEPMREQFGKVAYSGETDFFLKKVEASLYGRRLHTRIPSESRTVANKLTETQTFVVGPMIWGGKFLGVASWALGALTLGTDFFHERRSGSESSSVTTNFDAGGNITSVSVKPRSKDSPDARQTNIGLFLHNDWDPSSRWTVSAGGRVDYIRTTSETEPLVSPLLKQAYEANNKSTEVPLTGSLGLIFRPWEILHLTANVGKAFRAPATFESFASGSFGAGFLVPNPDLKSEEAVTYEAGTRLRLPNIHANVVAFYSDYSNLIVRRPVTFLGLPSSQSQNAGAANIQGVEIDATLALSPRWQPFMTATYLRGTDVASAKPLPYIEPFHGLAGLRYTPSKGLYVKGVSKWSLEKNRINDQQERGTPSFAIFNLYAGVDLPKVSARLPDVQLTLGLENLLDKAYRQPTTFEDVRFPVSNTNPLLEPGRAVSFSLTSRF